MIEETDEEFKARLFADLKKYRDFPIDWGGHHQTTQGRDYIGRPRRVQKYEILMWDHLLIGRWANITGRLERLAAGDKHAGEIFLGGNCSPCGDCGQELKGYLTAEGITIRSESGEPCPHPLGMPAYTFEIDIPSGRMVVANNLLRFFPEVVEPETHSICLNIGCRERSMVYAQAGLAHGSVLNTSPNVYRQSPEKLVIGVSGYIEPDEEGEVPQGVPAWLLRRWEEHPDTIGDVHLEGELVAHICTDLWWYCIADAEDLKRRGYQGEDPVVDVRPGRYRFTHEFQLHENREDTTTPCVYATIEWVSE